MKDPEEWFRGLHDDDKWTDAAQQTARPSRAGRRWTGVVSIAAAAVLVAAAIVVAPMFRHSVPVADAPTPTHTDDAIAYPVDLDVRVVSNAHAQPGLASPTPGVDVPDDAVISPERDALLVTLLDPCPGFTVWTAQLTAAGYIAVTAHDTDPASTTGTAAVCPSPHRKAVVSIVLRAGDPPPVTVQVSATRVGAAPHEVPVFDSVPRVLDVDSFPADVAPLADAGGPAEWRDGTRQILTPLRSPGCSAIVLGARALDAHTVDLRIIPVGVGDFCARASAREALIDTPPGIDTASPVTVRVSDATTTYRQYRVVTASDPQMPACTATSGVRARLSTPGGAGGTNYQDIVLDAPHATGLCSVSGVPAVRLLDGSGSIIVSSSDAASPPAPSTRVLVGQGRIAVSRLAVANPNNDPGRCSVKTAVRAAIAVSDGVVLTAPASIPACAQTPPEADAWQDSRTTSSTTWQN